MDGKFNKANFYPNETAVANLKVDNSLSTVACNNIHFVVNQRIELGEPPGMFRYSYRSAQNVIEKPTPIKPILPGAQEIESRDLNCDLQ